MVLLWRVCSIPRYIRLLNYLRLRSQFLSRWLRLLISNRHKPFSRLWISSLTPDAIQKGFQTLRDGREFEPLAAAARGRSQADWLEGRVELHDEPLSALVEALRPYQTGVLRIIAINH